MLANALEPEEKQRLATAIAQLPAMWSSLAEGLTNMCINDGKERQVFCQECMIIRRRLSEMQFIETNDMLKSCVSIGIGSIVDPTITAPAEAVSDRLPGDTQRRQAPFSVQSQDGGAQVPPNRNPGGATR